ncbi:MAG TPA: DUF2911 domain-containing protein [Myxococcales bacterium]|jgi:hypothetical protein
MKAALALCLCTALPAFAQQFELPRPSLSAKISQTAGLTEIALEYSSPAARGRNVFGGVVPFGEVWRTGANSCTKISFSKDVRIGSAQVPAGTYCLFTLPNKDRWTFIVNKDSTQFGAFTYKQALDVARVDVTPESIPPRERMTFIFTGANDDGVRLDLEWDRTRASLPIKLETAAQADKAIAGLERSGWRSYNSAAQWELDKKDYAAGLRLVETSLKLNENAQNLWTKAQLLEGKGQTQDARSLAQRALDLGKKDPNFEAGPEIQTALARWR